METANTNTETGLAVAEASNAVSGMHRKFNIPGDVVFKATTDLDDHARNAIRGMHGYAAMADMSIGELAVQLKLSPATISLVFRGKYDAKLDNVVKVFADFLKLHSERQQSRRLPFIKTGLSNQIWNVCDRAREFQRWAFLFSSSQIGKSEALMEYQRLNNHGSTIYVEMPTGGSLMYFLAKLCAKLDIGETIKMADQRRRIIDAFDDRMLLIVDEAHRAIPDLGIVPKSAVNTIDFIKEISNEKKCGVVICATDVFRNAMEDGAVKLVLKQIRRRRLCSMQLPTEPSREDLNTFAAAYGLAPATGHAREIEQRMIEAEALGMWLLLLRMAAKLAANRKDKRMTWNHVIESDAGLKAMETLAK